MRKLASVQIIETLTPIPNADAIELARVLGWNVVVKKGEFNVGDKVIYCEVDSLLPEHSEFEFLRKSCYRPAIVSGDQELLRAGFRIKTIRLRGQVSQGICFPINLWHNFTDFPVGTDVSDLLGIIKYEPPISAHLAGRVKGSFPSFIPKTDETRIQTLQKNVIERYKGRSFYTTEKLDGSSITVAVKGDERFICSRNLRLDENDDKTTACNVVRELDLFNKMRDIAEGLVIQGELIGPGIQKNLYGLNKHEIRVFNVMKFDGDSPVLVGPSEIIDTTAFLGMKTVPFLDRGFPLEISSVDDLVNSSMGKSKLNPAAHREGVVYRPVEPVENDPNMGRVSFKVINPTFLLKHED